MSRRYFDYVLFFAVLILSVLCMHEIAFAGDTGGASVRAIDWFHLGTAMLAGLTFFLYGIMKMSAGLQNLAGDRLRSVLAALVKNRVAAFFIGAFITVAVNSSSATTSMLVGFVQAELLSFTETLGVILGADIGTSLTVQLIAFRFDICVVYLVIAAGFSGMMFGRNRIKNVGRAVLGLGLLFFGMMLMKDAAGPLSAYPGLVNTLKGLSNPFWGILAGTAVAASVRSSITTVGIVMPFCASGVISLEAGIAVMLGANIGTCITAGLASLKKTREAKRVAIAHALFKVAGVAIFAFFLIPYLTELVRYLAAYFGSDPARQIANAHAVFNIVIALTFLPFTSFFAWLVYKIMPRRRPGGIRFDKWQLDESVIAAPELAFVLVRKKLAGMAKLLEQMLRAIIIPFVSDEKFIRREKLPAEEISLLVGLIPKQDETYPELPLLEGVDRREKAIDEMEEEAKEYLYKLADQEWITKEAKHKAGKMIFVANGIEQVADIAHRNLVPLIEKKRKLFHDFSLEGKEEAMIFHHKSCKLVRMLSALLASTDSEQARRLAREIMLKIKEYEKLKMDHFDSHLKRVLTNREESMETDEVHLEFFNTLNDINKGVGGIVKLILEILLVPAKDRKDRKKEEEK